MGAPIGSPLANSSGNVANAAAAATLTPGATKTAYLSGFTATGLGATAAGVALVTVSGLFGGVTLTYEMPVPAGATVGLTPLNVNFNPPLQGAAPGTAIVVSMAALGAGNTNACMSGVGFQL